MFWMEFTVLLLFIFCAEIMLVLEDLYGNLWLYGRDNHNMHALLLMLSLGASRFAGRIAESNGNTHKMNACGMCMCNDFEACRFVFAGDLRFTMISEQNKY